MENTERTDLGQTRKRIDTVLYIIESSSCKPETSTTTEINSTPREKINISLANKTKQRSVMCCPHVAAFGNNSGKTADWHLTGSRTEGCRKTHPSSAEALGGLGEDSEQGQ